MNNGLRGRFTVEFRGEALTLALGINAICNIEEARGESIFETLSQLDGPSAKISVFRDVVHGMLLAEVDGASLKDAGELTQLLFDDPSLLAKANAAIMASFPNDETAVDNASGKTKPAGKPRKKPARK